LADRYSIKNPMSIVKITEKAIDTWKENAKSLKLENHLIASISKDFVQFNP
jgi:hypothetical protein